VGAAFLVAMREGIEAALIISILLAYLKQIQAQDRSYLVWWGTGLAAAVSVLIGTVIFAIGAEFEGEAEQVFEGLVTLVAVGVLTWMIFWMRRQGARVKSELQERVDTALLTGGFALAALAFVAVLREGVETALFIFAAAKGTAVDSGGVGAQVLGATLGLLVAVVLGVLLYRGGLRLNLRSFFRITGLLLIVVAAGLFAYSLHELQEAGWLPMLAGTAFDISGTMPDDSGAGGLMRAIFGYQANPTWLELIGWFAYLIVVGGLFLRSKPTAPARTAEPVTVPESQASESTAERR
jgi:high-affinity iron transporter